MRLARLALAPGEVLAAAVLHEPQDCGALVGEEALTTGVACTVPVKVQGSPRKFDEDLFWYGYSYVQFEVDRVISWSDSGNEPLKARLVL